VNCSIIEFFRDPTNAGKQCYVNLQEGWRGRGLSFMSDMPYKFDHAYCSARSSLCEDEFMHLWMLMPGTECLRSLNPAAEESHDKERV